MASLLHEYWSSFREEMVATSLVLVVAVGGSFFILHSFLSPKKPAPPAAKTDAAQEIANAFNQTQGGTVMGSQTATPSPAAPTPTPTGDPYDSEVFYGMGGLYENDQYKLAINSPRLLFDAREASSRKFVVDMVLTNKTVAGGLGNSLACTIIKDGVVIVQSAAMSLSEAKTLLPGDSVTYQARISLIEGTDVSLVLYKPLPPLPSVEHILRP